VILPWVLVTLIIIHIVMIRMQGLAPLDPVGQGEHPTKGIPFAPNHVSRELVIFPLFFAALITLVIIFHPSSASARIRSRPPRASSPNGISCQPISF